LPKFIKGVSELIKRFEYKLENKTFIKKLSKISPDRIQREADSDTYHYDSKRVAYAKVLFKYYNKNLSTNRLSWPVE
jgi:hypothetical protein